MIAPTIGRKLWFFPPASHNYMQIDREVPCDATVVFVNGGNGGGTINLQVQGHNGLIEFHSSVELIQDGQPAPPDNYAIWMPFQVGQAAKDVAPPADPVVPAPTPPAGDPPDQHPA